MGERCVPGVGWSKPQLVLPMPQLAITESYHEKPRCDSPTIDWREPLASDDKLRDQTELVSFKVGERHVVITTKSVQAYLARRRAS